MAKGDKHFGASADPNYKNPLAYNTYSFGSTEHPSGSSNITGTENLIDGIYRVDISMINIQQKADNITVDFGTSTYTQHFTSPHNNGVQPTFRTYIVKIDKGAGNYVSFRVNNSGRLRSSVWSFEYLSEL